jgi:hypothetical protein
MQISDAVAVAFNRSYSASDAAGTARPVLPLPAPCRGPTKPAQSSRAHLAAYRIGRQRRDTQKE